MVESETSTVSMAPIRSIAGEILQQLPDSYRGLDYHVELGKKIKALDDLKRKQLMSSLHTFLLHMRSNEASDIDLGGAGCDGRIWYRVFGNKSPLNIPESLNYRESDILIHSIITDEQRRQLLENRNLDFSYSLPTQIGEEIRPFKTLGVHPEVAKALSLKYFKYGLTLITGITGSGKSSTLDTIIDANNRTVDSHIVIIASPVELIHKPKRSVVRHREVGRDVTSFKNGAIQALRQDPDIIVIGELRDPETIMTTLEITDSGHKTFGTLHTSSAMESIERILGEVPTEEQNRVRSRLADVLTGVISQKLVPSLDGKRVLAKEVLLVTPSVRAAIRNDNVNEIYQMLAEGSEKGMITMEQDLKRLYDEGRISKDEAFNNANNKKRIQQLFNELD